MHDVADSILNKCTSLFHMQEDILSCFGHSMSKYMLLDYCTVEISVSGSLSKFIA